MKLTDDMANHFNKRTKSHIKRVQKYANLLADEFEYLKSLGLSDIVKKHDLSKFEEPEYYPYVFVSWVYKSRANGVEFNVSNEMKEKMLIATTHHVLTNAHHPEFWSENRNPINPTDRDKPKELIDATTMPPVYLAEMVADWSSMAEEYQNEEGPYQWAEDNINIRWKFSDKQVKMIYEFMDFLWKDKSK